MSSSDKPQVAVLMAVYRGDDASHFKLSAESVLKQDYDATFLYLVIDGPISRELSQVVSQLDDEVTVLALEKIRV